MKLATRLFHGNNKPSKSKKSFVILFTIFLFILNACTNRVPEEDNAKLIYKDENHVVKQTFDKNGKLVKEKEFERKNGHLVAEGFDKEFYQDGSLKSVIYFQDGKANGKYYDFNETGVMKTEFFNLDDSASGSQYTYYDNGNLQSYSFYITGSEPRYHALYDSLTGEMTEDDGHLISMGITNNDGTRTIYRNNNISFEKKTCLSDTDAIEIVYFIASPKKTKKAIRIIISRGNEKIDTEDSTTFSTLFYSKKRDMIILPGSYFCNQGSGKQMLILKLYDSVTSRLLKIDTANAVINVQN